MHLFYAKDTSGHIRLPAKALQTEKASTQRALPCAKHTASLTGSPAEPLQAQKTYCLKANRLPDVANIPQEGIYYQ